MPKAMFSAVPKDVQPRLIKTNENKVKNGLAAKSGRKKKDGNDGKDTPTRAAHDTGSARIH